MAPILVAESVLIPLKFNEAKAEQPKNMRLIFVTLEASKPERLTAVSEVQPSNI